LARGRTGGRPDLARQAHHTPGPHHAGFALRGVAQLTPKRQKAEGRRQKLLSPTSGPCLPPSAFCLLPSAFRGPMYTETLTQRLALMNGIAPQQLNNNRLSTDGVDMQQSRRALFILSIGANAGSISAWLQESADNSSWTANDTAGAFSGSGGNNVSQTGLTTASKIYTFEVRADQLTAGKRYVRLQIKEENSANGLVAVVAFGDEGNAKPNNANNASAVTTQNVVA